MLTGLIGEWTPLFRVLRRYDVPSLLREFSDALRAEPDYGRDAANANLFRDVFAHEAGFRVPEIIAELSRNRVLIEERVEGRMPSSAADLPKPSVRAPGPVSRYRLKVLGRRASERIRARPGQFSSCLGGER